MSSENIDLENARIADTQYLVRRSMTKGYLLFSILTPPIYIGFNLFRKRSSHISVNRLLRATWLGGVAGMYRTAGCIAGGGAVEYVRSANSNPETLRSRRIRAALDRASHRADDHATIGALLCAVLAPAIFWKHGATINLVFGGAGLGTAAGYFTHIARSASGDVPPTPVVPHLTSDSES
ncbi:hypothetical protein BGY98DRAFT_912782 [Russula aff. rugulosa BPL654]|nr:hypothetical protein BGY98DRAFT_912782 [Russula aff. rugulosa BPL654]